MNIRRLTIRRGDVAKSILNTAQSVWLERFGAVINKTKWMLNRETIRPPHLATPMQVSTQPLQLQGMHHSCNSLLPGCCSGAEDGDNSHSHSELIKWFQELLHAAQMPRWIWENPLSTIDNHIICWFNSRASSRPRSVARYPADHRLQGNLQVLLCRAQTFALKEGLIRE